MKKRSREVNVFSMSALDLFASALGAFILVTVILFPYFPNTGDSEERVAEIRARMQAEIDRIEEELEQASGDLAAARQRIQEVEFPDLDLVIVLDVTGSMGEQVNGLREEAGLLANLLARLTPSVRIGVITFGDRGFQAPLHSSGLFDVATTAGFDRFSRFVNDTVQLNVGMGTGSYSGDVAEEVYNALQGAFALPWRNESRVKMVVLVTDSIPYRDEFEPSLRATAAFTGQGAGRSVSGVHVISDVTTNGESREYLRRLSSTGNGRFVPGGSSMTAAILLALL